jgi:hypothetical protein
VYTSGHAHGGTPERDVASAAAAAAIVSSVVWALIYVPLDAVGIAATKRLTARARRVAAIGISLALVGLFLAAVPTLAPWASRQYHAFVDLHVDQTGQSRFVDAGGFRYDLWRIAVKEFAAHPITGVGAGNYGAEYYRRRGNPQSVRQPHSLELQILAELGIFGALGFGLVLIGSLWAIARPTGLLLARDPPVRVAATGLFVAWLADTSVDWLYNLPGLTGMAVMSLGLLLVRDPVQTQPARRYLGGRAAVIGLVVLLALLAASTGRQYAGMLYRDRGTAQITRDPAGALSDLRTSQSLDPYAVSTHFSKAAAYARTNDYSLARAELLEAARLEPHNYVPWALLGDLEVRRQDFKSAQAAYRHAQKLNPRDGELLVLARDPREALRIR